MVPPPLGVYEAARQKAIYGHAPGRLLSRPHTWGDPMDEKTQGEAQERLKTRAHMMGWGRQFDSDEMFREKFEEMHVAVEALPPHLIERGRQSNYPQLHIACVEGDIGLVDALLVAGAGVDSYTYTDDEDDYTPLVWLARDEGMDPKVRLSVAKLLIKNGADVEEGDPIEAAEDAGNDDFAEFLRGV